MIPISILDLVPVIVGETPREALPKSLDLARHAESFGYTRLWLAEHHNMTGIASAATSVVIGYRQCLIRPIANLLNSFVLNERKPR